MNKLILSSITILLMMSCKSSLMNYALQKKGFYDDRALVSILQDNSRKIMFIHMRHFGTPTYYNDVAKKIDSLKNLNYYFYTEKVSMDGISKTDLMKFRKILGFGIPQGGYQKLLDSLLIQNKIELRKKMVYQPTYEKLGLDKSNSENVDANVGELVRQYESKEGEIILENCDYETPDVTISTKCIKSSFSKSTYQDLILSYRNQKIAKTLQNDNKDKIVLIYGSGHFDGIKEILALDTQK